MVEMVVNALKIVPEETRNQALDAAEEYLGESGFTAVLEELLASLPYGTDHPWWETIRERVGEKFYRKNTGRATNIAEKGGQGRGGLFRCRRNGPDEAV